MKKKWTALLLVGLLAVTGVLAVSFGGAATDEPNALQSTYKIGTTVEIPAVAGADTVVITPDGYAYQTDSILADKLGVYTVEYRGSETTRKTFETHTDQFAASGLGTAVYGKETKYQTGIDGIQVSLHDGETFTYNEIVDLRQFDSETSFFTMFATPTKLGERDVFATELLLTDAYDPSNYVSILVNSIDSDNTNDTWWVNSVFVLAGMNGTSRKGIEYYKNIVHTDNQWGFPIRYSPYGTSDFQNSVGKEFFSINYDLTENKLYGPKGKADGYIIDLDDPQYFQNNWKGFTTGEVYLSIRGVNYYGASYNFCLTKIGNCDLTPHTVYDRTPPTVTVDAPAERPTAGLNNPYPVFAASAYDGYSGKLPVTVKVFSDYRADNRFELPIADGKFTPKVAGAYTIEYTATDFAGNCTTETVSILCDGMNRTLQLTVSEQQISGTTGEPVVLADVATTGGVGAVAVDTAVTFDGKAILVADNAFTPERAGTYTVTVTAADFAGQTKTETYTVSITNGDRPIIRPVALPDAFLVGATYRIPTAAAYDYAAGAPTQTTVTVNGVALQNGVYTVPQNSNALEIIYTAGTATKTYTVPVIAYTDYASLFIGNATATQNGVAVAGAFTFANALSSRLTVSVDVTDALTLKITDYTDNKITASVALTQGRHTVAYNGKNLTVDGVTAATVAFGNGVRLAGNGNATVIAINGQNLYGEEKAGAQIVTYGNYNLTAAHGSTLNVYAAAAYSVVTPNTDVRVTVADPFKEKVLDNVAADVEHTVKLAQLGAYTVTYTAGGKSKTFTVRVTDSTAPVITLNGEVPKTVTAGVPFGVPTATAEDAVEGIETVHYYIVCPSGQIRPMADWLESAAGDVMSIIIPKSGTYKIRYFATDSQGNYVAEDYVVNVG